MFKKIKKIKTHYSQLVVSGIIASLIFVNAGMVDAATLQDIHLSSDYAKDAIIELAENNIIIGDESGNFQPDKTVTRAEMIKMIVNALEVDITNIPETPTFTDVPKTHWSYAYIEAAYREGITNGVSEVSFGKNDQCTREQMTLMFVRSLGLSEESINPNEEFTNVNELSDKDTIADWAKDAVEFSLASGLMNGTSSTTFGPKEHAQRQQAAVVIHRFINNKESILASVNDNSETVKYPNLYEALVTNEEYRGEFNMDVSMNINGTTPEEAMSITTAGTGAVNGSDSKLEFIMSVNQQGLTVSGLEFGIINVGTDIYVKDPGFENWIEATPEDMEEVTSFGISPEELAIMNGQFLDIYNELPIEEVGEVEINGVNATKYTLSLDNDTIKDLFPDELLMQDMDLDTTFDNAQLNFEIEYYLNEQNQIIKETLNYSGEFQVEIEEEKEKITLDMSIDINFENIGADIVITAPEIDSIEVTPEEDEIIS